MGYMRARISFRHFLIWIFLFFLGSCASTIPNDHQAPVLQAPAWFPQRTALEVPEAYQGPSEVYFKYRIFLKDSDQAREYYAFAYWDEEFQSQNKSVDPVTHFYHLPYSEWQEKIRALLPVYIISQQQSQEIRAALLSTIVPQTKKMGVRIDVGKNSRFLYYDEQEDLQSIDISDKPSDYQVQKSFTQEEMADLLKGSLSQFLQAQKRQDKKLLLVMSGDTAEEVPFLYVDFEKDLTVFLRPSLEQSPYRGSLLKRSIKSADYLLLDSHVLGMISRPFSSAFRLLTWSSGTAYDVLNPTKLMRVEKSPIPELYKGEGMDLEAWEKKLDRIVGPETYPGTINFLVGGDEFFPRLVQTLENAREEINVRIFIFDNDDFAVQVADLLKRKAQEGVKVKVLLDSMGIVMGEGKTPDDLPAGFIPPYSMPKYLSDNSSVKVRVRPSAWLKADHIKTICIDRERCFTGGMNIGREYRYDWHDLMMEVEGSVISEMIRDFSVAWEHAGTWGDLSYIRSLATGKKAGQDGGGYPIRLLYTRAYESNIFKAQVAAIKEAKKYIYINNAYFSDNTILYELIRARRRGVDVRVVLPVDGNHEIMNASNIVTANIMFRNGIRVFFYPGMTHIKAAIYDGWLCTGTANFDKLSFRDNLEMNVATSDPGAAAAILDQLFLPDFERSKEMTEPIKSSMKDFVAEFLAEQL